MRSGRRFIQAISTIVLNPFVYNLFRGRIYDGWLKHTCVPALNCYSCPAAFGACPIGSLQVSLSEVRRYLTTAAEASVAWAAVYVASFVALVGAVGGRFPCGWLCPFGLLQEVLLIGRARGVSLPSWTRLVKYALLAVFVIFLPLGEPYPATPRYCELVCPAGTVEAGLPIVGYHRMTGEATLKLGALFAWKVFLGVAFLGGALLVSRFFCRTACPLGAAWGLFNRVSLLAIEVDKGACTLCGFCRTVCPVDIYIYEDPDSSECVRCLECRRCPQKAVKFVVRGFGTRVTDRLAR